MLVETSVLLGMRSGCRILSTRVQVVDLVGVGSKRPGSWICKLLTRLGKRLGRCG